MSKISLLYPPKHSITSPIPSLIESRFKDAKEVKKDVAEEGQIDETVRFTIVGLMVSPEYQKCKYIAESLHSYFPEKFAKPELRPMLNLEWNEYLRNERRVLGGPLWNLKKAVAVYYNGNYMGDDSLFSKYLSTRFILPMKNFYDMGQEALREYFEDIVHEGRKCIYLTISINDAIIGTMLFVLYNDLVPKTCKLFLKRCRQLVGGYSGTPIHRIVPGSWIQCGGYRLKEKRISCENFIVSHNNRGVLSMCNSGIHRKNSTQFFITLEKTTWMDTNYVAFGQMLHGDIVLSQIEKVPVKYQEPQKDVKIIRAGEFDINAIDDDVAKYLKNLDNFLNFRMRRSRRGFKNYSSKTDLDLKNEKGKVATNLVTLKADDEQPLLSAKKSSCLMEFENCYKCGCSHDVKNCITKTSSGISIISFNN